MLELREEHWYPLALVAGLMPLAVVGLAIALDPPEAKEDPPRIRFVMRWTHLGHGDVWAHMRERYSATEVMLDYALDKVNSAYLEGVYATQLKREGIPEARILEEGLDATKAEREMAEELRRAGFKVYEAKEALLVEAEPGKLYYYVEWSPRDVDQPVMHPRLVRVDGAPPEEARRLAIELCEDFMYGADVVETWVPPNIEEKLSFEARATLEDLDACLEHGHAEFEAELKTYARPSFLFRPRWEALRERYRVVDVRPIDEWGYAWLARKHRPPVSDDVEWARKRIEKLKEELRGAGVG